MFLLWLIKGMDGLSIGYFSVIVCEIDIGLIGPGRESGCAFVR